MSDKFRGYAIEKIGEAYVFSDTGLSVADTWRERPCGHCNRQNTPQGHDACLETIPNIMNACCGHGVVESAYIQHPDGSVITGEAALKAAEILKNNIII